MFQKKFTFGKKKTVSKQSQKKKIGFVWCMG